MGNQLTNTEVAREDLILAGLRGGLGRDGIPIPACQTLGVEVREATAGSAASDRLAAATAQVTHRDRRVVVAEGGGGHANQGAK